MGSQLAPGWAARLPTWADVRLGLRRQLAGRRTLAVYVSSVAALNVASLVGTALAFRWIDPASMGVWHTLLLIGSYLTVVRLGLVNGMGRELPFALGSGDVGRAHAIVSTAYAFNALCAVVVAAAFLPLLGHGAEGPAAAAWRAGIPAMAVVSGTGLYLTFLQATFRSDVEFDRLARVHRLQALIGLFLPVTVYLFRFPGLCAHAALQAMVVALYAHRLRPFPVRPRFDVGLALTLAGTGLPLFAAAYIQTLSLGFDRVILLHHGGVELVGYYAPAVAVTSAMAIVPGAIATYVYPRMSHALGEGKAASVVRRTALRAGALSVATALPLAVVAWFVVPTAIARFFPQYVPSIAAVRWSLLSGTVAGLSAMTPFLGSLKAWPRLATYVFVLLVARGVFPWWLSGSGRYSPLEGVAVGHLLATLVAAAVSIALLWRLAPGPAPAAASAA